MKKLWTFFSVAFFVVFIGCGEGAYDHVISCLKQSGFHEGFNPGRNAVIEVASHEIELKSLEEVNESVRRKAMEIAYLQAVSKVANGIGSSMSAKEQKDMGVSVFVSSHDNTMDTMCSNLCVKVLLQAESCQMKAGRIEYMVAMAVVSSEKLSKTMVAAMHGDRDGMPAFKSKSSLKECVDGIVELNRLGPQIVHDAPRHFWILGTASQEIDDELDKNALRGKAAYAAECALGGNVNVEQSSGLARSGKRKKAFEESLSDHSYHLLLRDEDDEIKTSIKFTPFLRVNPLSGKIKWLERDKDNPLTGEKVRFVVAAIDSNDIPSFVRNGSSNVTAATRPEVGASAMDQAQKFLMKTELRQGFDGVRKIITLIVEDTFDYEKTMSDEEFARKRYLAVQRAFMMGAVDIARQIEQVADVSDRERRAHGFGRDWMFALGHVADEENDEGWIPQLMRQMTGREFSWMASLVGSRGTAKMEFPLYGLSIVRQFESLSEDVYQVALIVSLDMKKGKDEIMSFIEGKTVRSGDMSLRQWMDTQDFGLVAGPRRFVDNEGTIWALGIVPATEGQQPYGTLLDAAARECAAFAFGGDLAVSIKEEDSLRSITGSGDKAGDAENPKDGSFIKFKSVVCYPRELEQYFHRTYTHPVTGWKGVVAICALRSGSSKIMKEIYAQKIKKAREKKREEGMRAGMKDQIRRLTEKLREVREDIPGDKFWAIRNELEKLDEKLFERRSLRSENRDCFIEKLREIEVEIHKLKGDRKK